MGAEWTDAQGRVHRIARHDGPNGTFWCDKTVDGRPTVDRWAVPPPRRGAHALDALLDLRGRVRRAAAGGQGTWAAEVDAALAAADGWLAAPGR